jgi:CheY-like chemotaxis protein
MEAIGQLTGGISHDFNNLLTVIVGNIELLLGQLEGNASGMELANGALNSALHGADLTRRLLTFSRHGPVSTRIVDINALLRNVLTMLQRTLGESIQITVELADPLWRARIDPSQIEDALVNLTINARDAMPNGGAIVIRTENLRSAEHDMGLPVDLAAGDYISLSVTDTGIGMSSEVLERAMEPFFTTKEPGKGTGLGLSMVYGFAKQAGGYLAIESKPGLGTTIKIYLPRALEEDQGDHDDVSRRDALPKGEESVLLVEDNADLRSVEIKQLTELGYRVSDVGSGPDALKLFEAGERFDLLFTDIGLPDGMTGYQLVELARRHQPGLRVLFTTGYIKVAPERDETSVVQRFLQKPYRRQELATKIREALDSDG